MLRVLLDGYEPRKIRNDVDDFVIAVALGARVIGAELAKSIVDVWLASEFDEQSGSAPKVRRMIEIDEKYLADTR